MMSSSPISVSVWFACKTCRHSFQNIDNFIRHKRDVHFDEFQNIKCIVFEERSFEKEKIVELATYSKDKNKTTEIEQSFLSVLMKQESQIPDQFNDFNSDDMLQSDTDADLEPETETDTSINNTSNFSVACSNFTLGVEKQAIQENEVHSTLQETQPVSENATTDLEELHVDLSVNSAIDPGPNSDPDPNPVDPVAPTRRTETDAVVHLTRLTFSEIKTAIGTDQSSDFALSLRHWLINQGSKSLLFSKRNDSFHTNLNSPTKANFILLDPNPITQNVGPITRNNPITCKLCSKILESEWEVKTHTKRCWLYNKINHSYCISCDQTFPVPEDFRRHAKNHIAGQVRSEIQQKLKLGKTKASSSSHAINSSRKIFSKAQAAKFANTKNLTKNRQVFRCPFCSITFHRNSVLILHLKSHRNVLGKNKKGSKFYSRIPSYSPKPKQQCSRS